MNRQNDFPPLSPLSSRNSEMKEEEIKTEETQDSVICRTDYWETTDSEVRVFLVDDGERHWYVAAGILAALKEHFGLLGEGCHGDIDADEITISLVPGDKELTRTEIEGLNNPYEKFPPCFRGEERGNREPTITATAAEWAAFYQDEAPVQLMSSVF